MDDINLLEIDINEFKKDVYEYYIDIFPEEERKPIELLESSYNRGYTKIIKILNNSNLIGFMMLNRAKENGYAVLDYLAILPQYRDKGFGTKALELLIKQEKKSRGIFIEIEKVGLGKDERENLIREKRQQFYEKIGFKRLKFDLLLFEVIYMPYVFSNIEIDDDLIVKEILNIYESISSKERIAQNCEFMRNLSFEELDKHNITW